MDLSVVICAYNTKAEYLNACLKSITNSTLKNYEILLIDDGSLVDYRELAEKYGAKYVKTENRGLLAARLYALELVSGEYIAFVDSDDMVSFNYHMPMLEKAKETGADIVINNWAFYTDSAKYYCTWEKKWTVDWQGDVCLDKFLENRGKSHAFFVLWNKIIKTDLYRLAKKEVEATEAIMKKMVFSEDALQSFFLFKHAKRVVNIHNGYYFYRIHDDQSVNAYKEDALKAQIDQMVITLDTMKANVTKPEHIACVEEWSAMMSRTQYSYAKADKFTGLYDYIKEKYGITKLKEAKSSDGAKYLDHTLLPDNFEDIDKELYKIYSTSDDVTVMYDTGDKYVSEAINYISSTKVVAENAPKRTLMVPKGRNSFRNKLFHCGLVTHLGAALFKKGSKLRAKIKALL